MRILFLNQAPLVENRNPPYDVARIEAQLKSYASEGTRSELVSPTIPRRRASWRPSAPRACSMACII